MNCSKSNSVEVVIISNGDKATDQVEKEVFVGKPILTETEEKDYEAAIEIINAECDLSWLKWKHCQAYLKKHGIRLTDKKAVLVDRIREHHELRDCGGQVKYPLSTFVADCQGDVCIGDVVLFKQHLNKEMFDPFLRRSCHPLGIRTIAGRIINDSYGILKQQRTITIEVLWSSGVMPFAPLQSLRFKGQDFCSIKVLRQLWTDEEKRKKILLDRHATESGATGNETFQKASLQREAEDTEPNGTSEQVQNIYPKESKSEQQQAVQVQPQLVLNSECCPNGVTKSTIACKVQEKEGAEMVTVDQPPDLGRVEKDISGSGDCLLQSGDPNSFTPVALEACGSKDKTLTEQTKSTGTNNTCVPELCAVVKNCSQLIQVRCIECQRTVIIDHHVNSVKFVGVGGEVIHLKEATYFRSNNMFPIAFDNEHKVSTTGVDCAQKLAHQSITGSCYAQGSLKHETSPTTEERDMLYKTSNYSIGNPKQSENPSDIKHSSTDLIQNGSTIIFHELQPDANTCISCDTLEDNKNEEYVKERYTDHITEKAGDPQRLGRLSTKTDLPLKSGKESRTHKWSPTEEGEDAQATPPLPHYGSSIGTPGTLEENCKGDTKMEYDINLANHSIQRGNSLERKEERGGKYADTGSRWQTSRGMPVYRHHSFTPISVAPDKIYLPVRKVRKFKKKHRICLTDTVLQHNRKHKRKTNPETSKGHEIGRIMSVSQHDCLNSSSSVHSRIMSVSHHDSFNPSSCVPNEMQLADTIIQLSSNVHRSNNCGRYSSSVPTLDTCSQPQKKQKQGNASPMHDAGRMLAEQVPEQKMLHCSGAIFCQRSGCLNLRSKSCSNKSCGKCCGKIGEKCIRHKRNSLTSC